MLRVYLNYPHPKVSVHGDPDCLHIEQRCKANQRRVAVHVGNVSAQLMQFDNGQHRFNSDAELNDMWIHLVFEDDDFELAVAHYVHHLLGRRYRPFREAILTQHCS